MSHLLREHAPITSAGWDEIDSEARERLAPNLAARKLVDFTGPLGWEHSATNLGRIVPVAGEPIAGVEAVQRRVLPLVELRAPFTVSRAELRDRDRGAVDIDLDALDAAVQHLAIAENVAVFHGLASAGIQGVAEATTHPDVPLGDDDWDRYPTHVARAVEMLLSVGITGPYGLALSPDCYTGVVETTERGGYPLLDHLRKILGGPLVWAPGVRGAVVVSLRGGDFLFESGQDLSVGYDSHDADVVNLYLEESFSFRVATPEAAVALTM
ncbi:family 1 encapsulin nanocompartment shell protein [Capillimicrobium parvum]|uniref:Type 1 encapsulin shell protein n=1 Tax=Capillimicrobium parvum TaxID=2884022 RepID=A0A9E6XVC0_9ACTN|nr:family 1 encapsulin nanocompartment shell protein [Capillimicrobium parvum]UGS34447.1 Linocin-M18 [Capillimicrobium parvum]